MAPFPVFRSAAAVLLVLVTAPALAAQRTWHDNTNSWYIFSSDVGVSEHWSAAMDVQDRRSGPIEQPQAFFIRGSANYALNPATKVGFGLVRSESYPFGEIPSAYQAPEWRTFEQVQLSNSISDVAITHRYRLEQRWQGRRGADTSDHEIQSWQTSGRFRYFLKGQKPVGPVYVSATNEVFIAFGQNVGTNLFDQDRLAAVISRKITNTWRAEVGFLEQVSVKNNGKDIERNHTLTIGGYYSRPWSK